MDYPTSYHLTRQGRGIILLNIVLRIRQPNKGSLPTWYPSWKSFQVTILSPVRYHIARSITHCWLPCHFLLTLGMWLSQDVFSFRWMTERIQCRSVISWSRSQTALKCRLIAKRMTVPVKRYKAPYRFFRVLTSVESFTRNWPVARLPDSEPS